MNKKYTIAVLPGDGIGPEVMKQACKVLFAINKRFNTNIKIVNYDFGGIAIEKYNTPLPDKTIIGCEKSDAVLLGSVGGEKWKNLPIEQQPEVGGLLSLRKHFDCFINMRSIKLKKELFTLFPLKTNYFSKDLDILCIRELTGGVYFGEPKGNYGADIYEYSFDTGIYFQFEIERIAHAAFLLASKRRNKLTSIDKSNVLQSSRLWRKTISQVAKFYPEVELCHLYVDNAVMQLIKNPFQFDVLVTSNLFGDIISDECAALTGSIGMLPSASMNESGFGLYEPIGGSAPDIAGKNIANPIAQILSVAMLMRYSFDFEEIALTIENAVNNVLINGYYTSDLIGLGKLLNTNQMGDIIADSIISGT